MQPEGCFRAPRTHWIPSSRCCRRCPARTYVAILLTLKQRLLRLGAGHPSPAEAFRCPRLNHLHLARAVDPYCDPSNKWRRLLSARTYACRPLRSAKRQVRPRRQQVLVKNFRCHRPFHFRARQTHSIPNRRRILRPRSRTCAFPGAAEFHQAISE